MNNAKDETKSVRLSNSAMRVGLASDLPNIAGWCLYDGKGRKWIDRPELTKKTIQGIVRSGKYAWGRRFVIENGQRVILV